MCLVLKTLSFLVPHLLLSRNMHLKNIFIFKKVTLEKQWTLSLSEDSPPRCSTVSEQPLSLKVKQLSQDIL